MGVDSKIKRIRFRRGTEEQWTEANPILRTGEMGIELDSFTDYQDIRYFKAKLGDDETEWNDLPYIQIGIAGGGGGGGPVSWDDITDKPSTFDPSAHTHAISEVTGLGTALDGKADDAHTHAISDVTGLQDALDGKADDSHIHAISDVSGLQDELDDKADLVGGVIPTSQIPAQAITEFLGDVASQSAMLALTGQRGDWCIRTDVSRTYILIADDASVLANWRYVEMPGSPVTSVNGQTGVIVLGKSDIGLGNVPNVDATSRANHTGTQDAATITGTKTSSFISDFLTAVLGAVLTGLGSGSNTAISALDTLLVALAKLQAQITALTTRQRFYTLTSEHSTTSDTEGDITGFSIPVEANTYYHVSIGLFTQCSGTGGIKFGFKFPSGFLRVSEIGRTSSLSAIGNLGSIFTSNTGLMPLTYNTANQAAGQVMMNCTLKTGVTGGNFIMTMASVTNGQTSRVREYSTITITKYTPEA